MVFVPQQQSWPVSWCWWCVSRSCCWCVPAGQRHASGSTPSGRWSWGRGTRCRWTGARGSRAWTWQWVWRDVFCSDGYSVSEFRSTAVRCSVGHFDLCLCLCSSTNAWATWSAARGATATPPPKAPPTPAVRPAAGGRGVAIGTACVAQATAAATVRLAFSSLYPVFENGYFSPQIYK